MGLKHPKKNVDFFILETNQCLQKKTAKFGVINRNMTSVTNKYVGIHYAWIDTKNIHNKVKSRWEVDTYRVYWYI